MKDGEQDQQKRIADSDDDKNDAKQSEQDKHNV